MELYQLHPLSPLDLKLISIVVISVGCFVSGLLPVLLGLGSRQCNSLLMSSALCFGGGILLATSIVHILPDIQKDLPQWSELVFCFGFLLIYFLDVVVQIITSPYNRPSSPLFIESTQSYGTIGQTEEDQRSLSSSSESSGLYPPTHSSFQCSNFTLLLAFSIHSLLEGLVIGVEATSHGVLLLLLAVCCHKIIVSFCLGAELCSDGRPFQNVIPPLSIFVFGSAIGIGVGALLNPSILNDASHAIIPVVQGLAGGTLLYVVVSEILPRERRRFASPTASIVQFLSVSFGFGVMAVLSSFS